MSSNEHQNASNVAIQQPLVNTPHRRVLGDVSPNIKAASPVPAFLKKPPASSPLKRSYTAAMEGGEGLMYLKKRKLSDEETLSQMDGVSGNASWDESGQSNAGTTSLRPIFQPMNIKDFQPSVPEITEPSPTEPNTPSDEGDSTQGSSAERKSFSSLINYDPSSQTSNLVLSSISHAELLKLRLRVAMYKVRTNQVDVPFTDLRVPEHTKVSKSSTAQAVEEAVAQLRQEAMEVNARQSTAILKLLPAPVLKPTAYSSRMVYETNIPSSPPVSLSPDKLPSAPTSVFTPQKDLAQYGTPRRSVERLRMPPEELTSSAVKGRVAEGLLGLRHAS